MKRKALQYGAALAVLAALGYFLSRRLTKPTRTRALAKRKTTPTPLDPETTNEPKPKAKAEPDPEQTTTRPTVQQATSLASSDAMMRDFQRRIGERLASGKSVRDLLQQLADVIDGAGGVTNLYKLAYKETAEEAIEFFVNHPEMNDELPKTLMGMRDLASKIDSIMFQFYMAANFTKRPRK
jgi:HAMP domain-containing protein